MLEIALAAVAGLAVGWLARGSRRNRRFRAAQVRWQAVVDELQGKLALERLRMENHLRDTQESDEPAPALDLHREPKLARPHARSSDSTAARA